MRITKENRRLARKRGWYDGHRKDSRTKWPYEEVQLCMEYDAGYWEGFDADPEASNPYGVHKEYTHKSGWYFIGSSTAHFFRDKARISLCGRVVFKDGRRLDALENGKRCIRCASR